MYNKIDVVIMAGGLGKRLLPLTTQTPKPLLKVGLKPIIQHNIDLLASKGIKDITISVNYLSQQIIDYFNTNNKHQINFKYLKESKPLGTIGSLKLLKNIKKDYLLVMNADLLTNVNLDAFINEFKKKEGDVLIATIPYKVNIPHGVVETESGYVKGITEKPSYTYYSNAGIYIFKKEHIDFIPENTFFNATDLIELLLAKDKKIINYPILDYWLDIGNHKDFKKAQEDVKHLKL